jgi:hypothetical protein
MRPPGSVGAPGRTIGVTGRTRHDWATVSLSAIFHACSHYWLHSEAVDDVCREAPHRADLSATTRGRGVHTAPLSLLKRWAAWCSCSACSCGSAHAIQYAMWQSWSNVTQLRFGGPKTEEEVKTHVPSLPCPRNSSTVPVACAAQRSAHANTALPTRTLKTRIVQYAT